MQMDEPTRGQYARAARLMDELERLRRVWMGVRPTPPLGRSDLGLLGLLSHLEHEGTRSVNVSMLARKMHHSLPGVSKKLSVLEDAGYVRRKTGKADRRVAHIELTAKGRRAAAESWALMLGTLEDSLAGLGEADADTLLALLQRLNESAEQVVGDKTEQKGEDNT